MTRKPTVAIIGAGNLGSALALSLHAVGYTIAEVVVRRRTNRSQTLARRVGARLVVLGAPLSADLVWLCVPDQRISNCAGAISTTSNWAAKVAFHASGALTSDELHPLRNRGAAVASVHPLMTFVQRVIPSLASVPFALEGDKRALPVARRIVRDLGGLPFSISKQHKPAYHAWGGFASPLLLSVLVTAERVAGAAGIKPASARKMMLPIVHQTLSNYAERGPDGAFSGPVVRGDADTIRKHLRVLRRMPEARDVYLALVRAALRNLPTRNPKGLADALKFR